MGSYNPLSKGSVESWRRTYEKIGLCYECGTPLDSCPHGQQREIDEIKEWLELYQDGTYPSPFVWGGEVYDPNPISGGEMPF